MRALSLIVLLAVSLPAQEKPERLPRGKALRELVRTYLEADAGARRQMRSEVERRYEALPEGRKLAKLRKDLLAAAARVGPRIRWTGRNFWYGEKEKRQGKYLVSGKGRSLFFGLHGGGAGVGSAESAARSMNGGGRKWIHPEVLVKTGRGWTTAGTEEFIIELVRAAKRSGKVDPDRIYIAGHSMGGFGTWTLGAHHADVFAGGAAFAGAPTPMQSSTGGGIAGVDRGVIPNWFNARLHVFQSTDDRQVRPEANQYATRELADWKEQHPDGFDFRYVEVHDRGHRAPKEGYGPSLSWVEQRKRNPRPSSVIWEPVLSWKRHFFWIWWEKPDLRTTMKVMIRADNEIHVEVLDGEGDLNGLSFFLPPEQVDVSQPVKVFVDGEAFKTIQPVRSLATLLQTLPRHDDGLLFEARIDL